MRALLFGFGLLALAAASPILAQNKPPQLDRAGSVISAFQVICELEPLNFDRIDQKATAMRMHQQSSTSNPSTGNTVIRSKSWAGMLTDGAFLLLLDEMSGAKGRTTSCAIVADVPDRDAFRTEAIRVMKLPPAPEPELGRDGSRSYFWDKFPNQESTVLDRDFAPSGKPGVMLKLISMERAAQ